MGEKSTNSAPPPPPRSKLAWKKGLCVAKNRKEANLPTPRSGHTFNIIGANAYMFGGLTADSSPSSSLYILRLGTSEHEWTLLDLPTTSKPSARWKHTSTLIEGNGILFFGGFKSSTERFNDVWVFNTVTLSWSQPNALSSEVIDGNHTAHNNGWPNLPSPRACHSASFINKSVYVFGGYGGFGYSRRDLDDLHCLDTTTYEWSKITPKGTGPEKRSCHQSTACDSMLYVYGGKNSIRQFDDMFVLDTSITPPLWSTLQSGMPSTRWNHASCGVMAIPSWKIFIFGGTGGEINENDFMGKNCNDISMLDTGTLRWTSPQIHGDLPEARSETVLSYDAKGSKLMVFGGWDNKWFNDVYMLDVGSVVGPPYAIMDIYPKLGPITGSTCITITGIDFVNSCDVIVRFASKKMHVDVKGLFVSQSKITCVSPDCSIFGQTPGMVEVRVALNGDSFTTTFQGFNLFALTDTSKCIMYGPGILSGCAVNEETMFVIHARDEFCNDRTSGGDEFNVIVLHLGGGEEGEDVSLHSVSVQDQDDGTYVVMYTAPSPGEYEVQVDFKGSFGGKEGVVRGSPAHITFEEFVSRDNNTMAGKLVLDSLKQDLNSLLDFTKKTNEGITAKVRDDEWTNEQAVNSLVSVKEHMNLVTSKKEGITTIMDRSNAILFYLRAAGINVGSMETHLKKAKSTWESTIKEMPAIDIKIAPLVKLQGSKMREDIKNYEAGVLAYLEEVNESPFLVFSTGASSALMLLSTASEIHSKETKRANEMLNLANMFECPRDMQRSQDMVESVTELLSHFNSLWECAQEAIMFIEEAQETRWVDINAEGMEEAGKDMVAKVRKLNMAVKKSDAFIGLDKHVKEFLRTSPLIGALNHQGMRDRHWQELMVITNVTFEIPSSSPDMRLREILDLSLHNFGTEVEEICEKAVKEAKQEETINNLKQTWSTIQFQKSIYKDTDVPLLKLSEEDIELLEADQLTLQGMVGSRYLHFKEESSKWQKWLTTVSEVNQILSQIQRMWSYLEPLFIGSDEVKKELPQDAKRFAKVDEQVRLILKKCDELKIVKTACTQTGLFAQLETLQRDQETCKKSLSDFLDGKRRQFPRFYFMSEADLLDILSNGSMPAKVVRHVDKVFLATKNLELEESASQRPKAKSFVASVGKEVVEFDPHFALDGKVEHYLQTILDSQKSALRKRLDKSMKDYPNKSRTDWLMSKTKGNRPVDPAQISILVAAIQYVQEVESTMEKVAKGNAGAMEDYNALQVHQLQDLIKLVQSDLSLADRTCLMVMITMDSHYRDVVETLVREKVVSKSGFQWQCQLRQKYTRAPDMNSTSSTKMQVCDASFDYGFEYLGNGPRLVITPLTDRIYVTATQALNLKMGCAPSGPAGTGKTESIKDLASALGKCCYVFNCSPEIDYQSLGDIFKGLAASGSWGCFDEFNRLIPEVLSVCSVQFKAVCEGNKRYSLDDQSSHSIVVEGDTVKLDPTNGAFITMNPGYLGRSELPEGLKALFRPLTVMVPDLVLICENMLTAEGFVSAKALASKFYTLYTLLSNLLSKQEHYDWGLRAIKSVLVVAGAMKRASPDLPEDALLVRALRDTNTSKIVGVDVVVFYGLLNDLFPGLSPPRVFDEDLNEHLTKACELHQLWPDETFKLKCMQLDELLAIRHCVFAMGSAGCGKSATWKMLSAAITLRDPTKKVKVVDLNPKVLLTEDLYGHVSLITREWKDGLLSTVMRDLGQLPDDAPKWILLDGDLDANWIESMNSVMDDNRMLTLASNERIPLKPHMRMIFEIRDLRYATPATVSRAGVLFISTDAGTQWRSLIASWVQSRPEGVFSDDSRVLLQGLFEKYMPDAISYFAKEIRPIVATNATTIVCTLLRLLDGLLAPDTISNNFKLETAFVFAAIWAFGSALTTGDDGTEHQKIFSEWWRSQFKAVRFPTRDTVFDYWLDPASNKFEPWKLAPSFKSVEFNSQTMQMSEVTVSTTETASILYWAELLVKRSNPVMLAGPAGTGKTQLINGLVRGFKPKDEKLSLTINMNFYSTAVATIATLEAPLQKRTGSTYGPPGSASMVYFIDDLNLPEVDSYNTQSAIALIRQHIDYQHWYDPQKLTLKTVLNCQYITAMNPTAGSFMVNPRLQRHFTTFAVGMPSATSLLNIYETFLAGHLVNNEFNGTVTIIASTLIKGALAIHNEVSDSFRKTATNFHYEFNIRHLAAVFSGLLTSAPADFDNAEKFAFLWLHETERVYGDRIVDAAGLAKFKEIMQNQAKKSFPQFNAAKFYLASGEDPLIFCHFANVPEAENPDSYNQVSTIDGMKATLEAALEVYNDNNALMDLVLFNDAICHVGRITRIIRNTAGHAMLVGVGGSGRQSLTRLAAHICNYSTVQITVSNSYGVSDLKSDLQSMYRSAGILSQGVVFLFTDNQIANEKFLVYLNDLLASGNIPDLYTKDEQDDIINEVIEKVKAAGLSLEPDSCWKYFINEVRKNLHCVLCFSPVGDDYRSRARKFPALVNCTVFDWFHPWPHDALLSVGKKFLSEMDLGPEEVRQGIESFMPQSFLSTQQVAAKFYEVENRLVYSTPKTYLEFLKYYGLLLKSKRDENITLVTRLTNGVEKLEACSVAVTDLESNLKQMLVQAEEMREVSEGIAVRVSAEREIVEAATAAANVENEKVEKMQNQVSAQQAEAEAALAKAEPAVLAAMSALDTLDRKDLGQCKTMSKPPPGVGDIFSAVTVLLAGINPSIVAQKNGKVKDKDRSWEASKKNLLGNVNGLIDELREFKDKIDNGEVPVMNFKEIRPYLVMEHFSVEVIEKKNSAAAGLCSWVLNIVAYYDIFVIVAPKRILLKEVEEKLDKANVQLAEVQGKVRDLQERLNKLTSEFDKADADQSAANIMAGKGKLKMELAQRLTNALGSEGSRWTAGIEVFKTERELIVGNTLLAAAFISYVGPFTKEFRDELIHQKWIPFLMSAAKGQPIAMSASADALTTLSSESEIAGWSTQGLPADPVSSENGAIVCNSSRWPLIIDPQLQGISWIRSKESNTDRNLRVTRLGHPDLLSKLEASIENGWSLLIENMGEKIDAFLMTVISRAVTKRASRFVIKIGENEVEYNDNFRLFMHTKLSNPHYPPEIQAECTLVNFTVTLKGLEDQLLSLVVRKERPDLASQKAALIMQENQSKVQLKKLEDEILIKMSAAEGDIAEDRDLIEGLEEAKHISIEVNLRLEQGKVTNEKITETSEAFRSVATRGSLLFFLMNDLHKIHTFYSYSLNAFVVMFQRGISAAQDKLNSGNRKATPLKGMSRLKDMAKQVIGAERFDWNRDLLEAARMPSPDDIANLMKGIIGKKQEEAELGEMTPEIIASRCKALKSTITETLYDYLRRGLFEKDKLTIATLLTFQIQQHEGTVNKRIVEAMTANATGLDLVPMSAEIAAFMPEELWNKLKGLEEALGQGDDIVVPLFAELSDKMALDAEEWGEWYHHASPENKIMPGEFADGLQPIEKLLVVRALRPDRVSAALQQYLIETMGKSYIEQAPFDMSATYQESSASTPIFFVLFPGVDPTGWVEALGKSFDIGLARGNFVNISMGQGQEKPAELELERMAASGGWIMLQNVHLMQSWLVTLDSKLEMCAETADPGFRCFISAEAPPLPSVRNMPEALLHACIKVANEAPADLKSNLTRAWASFDQDRLDNCSKPKEFRSCLFGLCFFHSLVLGRKRFGAQGWSKNYGFSTGDLSICADVLTSYLNACDEKRDSAVPFDDLRYIFGEIMYGGHITDFWDRRTNATYLSELFTKGLMESKELAPRFVAPDPVGMDYTAYSEYINRALPAESSSMYGLHPNAEIGYLSSTTDSLFGTLRKLRTGSAEVASAVAVSSVVAAVDGEGRVRGRSDSGSGVSTVDAHSLLRATLDDLLNSCPNKFDLNSINARAKPLINQPHGPFVLIATQECTRMNVLLDNISSSLAELKKGLNGQLNMSQPMEHLLEALSVMQVPGRNPLHTSSWEKAAWPSKKPLRSWFADLLARNSDLRKWSETLVLPKSLWLPGLFNPTAFFTAVKQVTARAKNIPLDSMAVEMHVTKMVNYDEAKSVADYPSDGAFIHGLFIEGARWLSGAEAADKQYDVNGVACEGCLAPSKLKELIPRLPVLYVKAVEVDETWRVEDVGHLSFKEEIYNCPVYTTRDRGAATFVTVATLKVDVREKEGAIEWERERESERKWVLAGVCILLQRDD